MGNLFLMTIHSALSQQICCKMSRCCCCCGFSLSTCTLIIGIIAVLAFMCGIVLLLPAVAEEEHTPTFTIRIVLCLCYAGFAGGFLDGWCWKKPSGRWIMYYSFMVPLIIQVIWLLVLAIVGPQLQSQA